MRRVVGVVALLSLVPQAALDAGRQGSTDNELDVFMEQVLARRDDNWRKLQQYILDEQERIDLRGPGGMLVWGAKRDYTWYVRDGFFVRSPVRFNGVAIGEKERQLAEERFLRRARERDKRGEDVPPDPRQAATDVQGLIQQTREPQFISSAYFLRFKFEPGRYAIAGREAIDGREVLRIEYYPTKLFSDDDPADKVQRRQSQAAGRRDDKAYGAEVQRLINKKSLVTLWVEPTQHQVVKYTFDNVGFDFLPMAWLVRVADLKATMSMTEAFPGVWLPRSIDSAAAIVLAPGRFDMSFSLDYRDYREAKVSTKIRGASVR